MRTGKHIVSDDQAPETADELGRSGTPIEDFVVAHGRVGAILKSGRRKFSWARLPIRPMVAMLPVTIAFCLQWVLWQAMCPWAWLLLYPGVFFSSWLGGLRVGLLATAMSTQSSSTFRASSASSTST